MARGTTDPNDDNMWHEGVENSYCAVIQGLSPNADIPAHADNDLPRPYATYRWRPLKGTLWHRSSQQQHSTFQGMLGYQFLRLWIHRLRCTANMRTHCDGCMFDQHVYLIMGRYNPI